MRQSRFLLFTIGGQLNPNDIVRFGCLICLVGLTVFHKANGQSNEYPIFSDQKLQRPDNLKELTLEDFSVDPNRLSKYPSGFFYAGNATLDSLFQFYSSDPVGKKLWKEEGQYASRILNQWDFDYGGFAGDRYIYRIPQLQRLALIYLLTGNSELGQFIKGHVMLISDLPFEFWLHSELRGYDENRPKGGLETSSLCTTLTLTISATSDLYSKAEREKTDSALYNKGLVPCLTWLDRPWVNNWTAVVSTGAFVTAKYFNDLDGLVKSRNAMLNYLQKSIEQDGSYGEGVGYFDYPIRSLFPAVLVMSDEERRQYFEKSGLKFSSEWKSYPYLYAVDTLGRNLQTIVHFGDNSYLGDNSFIGPTQQKVNLILSALYADEIASWLIERFGDSLDIMERMLLYSIPNGMPNKKSPREMDLPLVKAFEAGDAYIRSSWDDNGIVMGMWSGDGSSINFSHQRPELGSISMGAYGEYLVVSPGSASYRSALHYQWDRTTRSANTITIDNKNQLFPGDGSGHWNTTDVSEFWVEGDPKAQIVQTHNDALLGMLLNDLKGAYHVPMKQATRTALFVRDPGYFVLVDRMVALEGDHQFTWRLHLNNRDGKAKIQNLGTNHWFLSRPRANLDIQVFSDKNTISTTGKGYMHGPGRDYSPGGPNEGWLGSSIELQVSNDKPKGEVIFYSVIYPLQKSFSKPKVKYKNNTLKVGESDKISIKDGFISFSRSGIERTIELPNERGH